MQRWIITVSACLMLCGTTYAEELEPVAFNSMLDKFQADGIPDEIRPHARDYVAAEATVAGEVSYVQETRTFAEFKIAGRKPAKKVTLVFNATRHNTPHVADQEIYVAYYSANGTIELDDWSRPATDIGKTPPIKGFNQDKANRGEPVPMSFDITQIFNGAVRAGQGHLAFSFRKKLLTVIDNRDPLGYSGLNTIDACRLRIDEDTKPPL